MEGQQSGRNLLKLAIGALGVVYGDIGTSPLYTLKECFSPFYGVNIDVENVYGILSLIFWAMIFVVVIKYILFIMRADNEGEGGVMSLLSLVIKKMKKSGKRLAVVTAIGIIGTALLLADGMITPVITVLGAMEGLDIATPALKHFVLPLSIAILMFLFFQQKRGTEKIGKVFGCVMILWFMSIAVLGIISILKAPNVLNALNPYWGYSYFVRNGIGASIILGAVVLALTGAEALYADIGHFGKKPIRAAFFLLVMPALIINYFGQGAAILVYGRVAALNPFYFICPKFLLIPMIIIATFAAIIASQALISGAFSIVQQTMQLGFLPKMRIIHTSHKIKGQIYLPFVNYFLMVCCIILAVTFKNSGNLAAAYGISVMGTMICTTILFSIVVLKNWKWNPVFAVPVLLMFFIVDMAFFATNFSKIASGGWFPLSVAGFFFILMTTWKTGSEKVYRLIVQEQLSIDMIIQNLKDGRSEIKRVAGEAVFMLGNKRNLNSLLHHLKHNKVLHEKVFLLSFESVATPYVKREDKVKINQLGQGFYEITAAYGYIEDPDINEIFELCNESGYKLNVHSVSFYLGRVSLGIAQDKFMAMWRKKMYIFMHKNAESAADYFKLPPGRVIELGRKIFI